MDSLGLNITFPIYKDVDGVKEHFNGLVIKKATVDSVIMSLGDKITGDVYYKDNSLSLFDVMGCYVEYKGVKYTLVNPPTIVREGMASDNGSLKGMTKYSFEFYHPMYQLSNIPFTDIAVSDDEERYLSQNKSFSWIGYLKDFADKLNANLRDTEWIVELSSEIKDDKLKTLSEVLSFNNNTIADALKTGYDTWEVPFVIDTTTKYSGKKFLILFGLPSNEIYKDGRPYVFKFGQGVGLKNNSSTPKKNKIITRIAGYGSEDNIPYGYPQIEWLGDSKATCTIGDYVGVHENVTINGKTFEYAMSYTIYDGIVGGRNVKLIKHPFTRDTLMPSVYSQSVNRKVNPYAEDYDPNAQIIDYYDAIGDKYPNQINPIAPSYESHQFEDVKPELGEQYIEGAEPYNTKEEEARRTEESFMEYLNKKVSSSSNPSEILAITQLQHDFRAKIYRTYSVENGDYKCEWTIEDGGKYAYISYSSSNFSFKYTVLRGGEEPDAPEWDDDIDDSGIYKQSHFKMTLPKLSFDLYACAAITKEMQISMRSGACIGCKFNVQVNWEYYKSCFYDSEGNFDPYGEKRDYEAFPDSRNESITIILQKDTNTFGTIMPNVYQNPKSGDRFVILGISLPGEYIIEAEKRLDSDIIEYMIENNTHYFDYPLKFDEYFLAKNTDILEQIRNNTIVRFSINGEEQALYVKQITIKYGEKVLPQYDITLTDDVEIVLNKIGQVTDDVSRLRVQFNELAKWYDRNFLQELNNKLSRIEDDIALGKITFRQGLAALGASSFIDAIAETIDVSGNIRTNSILSHSGESIAIGDENTDAEFGRNITVKNGAEFKGGLTHHRKGLQVGVYTGNVILGTGAQIDEAGNTVVESLTARSFFSAPEYRYNRITVTDGESWSTNGLGTIEEVTPISDTEGYISLYLDNEEYGSVAEGDICRGIYNEMAAGIVSGAVQREDDGTFDDCGFMKRYGFYTSYFWIKTIVEYAKGRCVFRYELRNSSTIHPCKFMKFAQYGNFIDTNRQSSSYENTHPAWYRAVYIGVNDWVLRPENISQLQGNIKGFTIKLRSGDYFTFDDRGIYIDKNIYFGQSITELDPAIIEDLRDELWQYNIELDIAADTITVDPTGNVIGGLWTEEKDEGNTYRKYRLHTAVTATKGDKYLLLGDDSKDCGDGEYKIHASSGDCEYIVSNGTVYITSIKNIKDQTAGTDDDVNFDYDAMREMEEVKLTIVVDLEGRQSVTRTFCVTVNHVDTAFISAQIDNQVANISWDTKENKYIGLPYTFHIDAWHNTEKLNIKDIAIRGIDSEYYKKETDTEGQYNGNVVIDGIHKDFPKSTNLDVTISVEYAGVNYERTITHTIIRTSDTNIYEIIPNPSSINSWKDGLEYGFSSNTVSCGVRCTNSDSEPYMLTRGQLSQRGLSLYVRTKSNGVIGGKVAYSIGEDVSVHEGDELFTFTLNAEDTEIDTQDVIVVSDGEKGKDGASISIKGKCVNHYSNYGSVPKDEYNRNDIILLDDGKGLGSESRPVVITFNEQWIYSYPKIDDGYVSEFDGRLWVAGEESWADAGVIQGPAGKDGSDAVIYEIESDEDSIRIAANDTNAKFESNVRFFRKSGENERTQFKCYSWVYVRKGSTYTLVSSPSSKSDSISVSIDKTYINVAYDAVVVFINDMTGNFNVNTKYLAKKEIPIRKDGDNGKGIDDVETQYALGDSYTSPPNSNDFSSSYPSMTNGKYVWMRQRYKYTDGTYSSWIYICTTGKPGEKGSAGKSIRVRGIWSKDTEYENNDDFIDVVLYATSSIMYNWYKCEQTHTSGSDFSTSVGGNVLWSQFSKFDNLSTSVLLANQGYVDVLGAGRIWVGTNDYGEGVSGWLMTDGMIRHTGTGLTLTKDGFILDPDGLHFKVGGTVKRGTNLLPDPYLDNAWRIGMPSMLGVSSQQEEAIAFGKNSYKIFANQSGTGTTDRDIFTRDVLAETYSKRIKLEPNKTYTFSLYAKSDNPSAITNSSTYVFLYAHDKGGTYQKYSRVPIEFKEELCRSSFSFSTEEDNLFFDFRFGFHTPASSNTNAYFDAVKLEEGNVATEMSDDSVNAQRLLDTGIDIFEKEIRITSDNFRIQNNNGEESMYVDKNGNVTIRGYLSEKTVDISSIGQFFGIFSPISGVANLEDIKLGFYGKPEKGNAVLYGDNTTTNVEGYPLFAIGSNDEYNKSGFKLDGFKLDEIFNGWNHGSPYRNYWMLDICKATGVINVEFQPRVAGGDIAETVIYLPWIQFIDETSICALRTVTEFGNKNKHYTTYEEMLAILGNRFILQNNTDTDMYVIYDMREWISLYSRIIMLPAHTSIGFTMVQELNRSEKKIDTYKGKIYVDMPTLYFKPDETDRVVQDISREGLTDKNFGEQVFFDDNE